MKEDVLHIKVHDVPSKYPVEHDKQDVADVHYLQGGGHDVHVLFKELG